MTTQPYSATFYTSWYPQIHGAADLEISELVAAFNNGVTPDEFNARRPSDPWRDEQATLNNLNVL